jgi:hypothetical protein
VRDADRGLLESRSTHDGKLVVRFSTPRMPALVRSARTPDRDGKLVSKLAHRNCFCHLRVRAEVKQPETPKSACQFDFRPPGCRIRRLHCVQSKLHLCAFASCVRSSRPKQVTAGFHRAPGGRVQGQLRRWSSCVDNSCVSNPPGNNPQKVGNPDSCLPPRQVPAQWQAPRVILPPTSTFFAPTE